MSDAFPKNQVDSISPIAAGTSIAAALRQAGLVPLEARVLLMHALGLSRMQLITQSEHLLTEQEAARASELYRRRMKGEPVAYITGQREFYGLSFKVSPDVLIPRPETELLVELASERLPQNGRMLDMGTGSGAIAVALAHMRADAQVTALDVSAAALKIARHNAQQHGVTINFIESDWYHGLGDQRFDVIAANPPYIVAEDPHLSQGDLRFEPASALTDHADGLSALRIIVQHAPEHLFAGGWLLMEHGYDQAQSVRDLLVLQGFSAVQSWQDLAGIERVSGGIWQP